MWILVGFLVGIIVGGYLPYQVPVALSTYVSVGILAGLDSVIGGTRAGLEHRFDAVVFTSGFILYTAFAIFLTWTGTVLGSELYLAAVVAFGLRVFSNLGAVRRHIFNRPSKSSSSFSS